jgi:hypothetical protein
LIGGGGADVAEGADALLTLGSERGEEGAVARERRAAELVGSGGAAAAQQKFDRRHVASSGGDGER